MLLDGTLGKNVQNFRTYLSPWSASAPGRPVAGREGGGRRSASSVAVSWNGATRGRLLARARRCLVVVARAGRDGAKSGFQTTLTAHTAGPYVAVQALDGSGAVLGTSATVKE